uniref:Uncharacterized protein n=1 Tax=Chromera velia CCMP2878 TaxID=1169474 RepID=A0A0G4HNS9_9ALVE|eukprot:Cvel_29653.t1-p1 / transcript=Cvel_29653.t1 / gene=Cvel_29653 / organism=Chromera_velia_CCMP2878 / gene_product=Protease Do-like 4, mitochondrial, putative / transcript_product=Protease Do-like 4, mitochondrial, putative / location=Cvel_scaffold4095:3726-7884(-) / protein_length=994 / sequence_SO=supercontig / SO=protein_coding / is_pseudo=false
MLSVVALLGFFAAAVAVGTSSVPQRPDYAPAQTDGSKHLNFLATTVARLTAVDMEFNWLNPFDTTPLSPGVGTGFFIQLSPPLLVTCAHVVSDALSLSLSVPELGKQPFEAHVIAVSPQTDVALLQIDQPEKFHQAVQKAGATIRSLNMAAVPPNFGEEVITVGFPLGMDNVKVGTGVISGTEHVEFEDENIAIQSTAPISPGSSGGPLVLLRAPELVVGINFAVSTQKDAENVNYAVPIWRVKQLYNAYKKAAARRSGGLSHVSTQQQQQQKKKKEDEDPNPAVVSGDGEAGSGSRERGRRLSKKREGKGVLVPDLSEDSPQSAPSALTSSSNSPAVSVSSSSLNFFGTEGAEGKETFVVDEREREKEKGEGAGEGGGGDRGSGTESDSLSLQLTESHFLLRLPPLGAELIPTDDQSGALFLFASEETAEKGEEGEGEVDTQLPSVAPLLTTNVESGAAALCRGKGGVMISRIHPISVLHSADPPVLPGSFLVSVRGVSLNSYGQGRDDKFLRGSAKVSDLLFFTEDLTEPAVITTCDPSRGFQTHKVNLRSIPGETTVKRGGGGAEQQQPEVQWSALSSRAIARVYEAHFEGVQFEAFADLVFMSLTMNHVDESWKKQFPDLSEYFEADRWDKPKVVALSMHGQGYAPEALGLDRSLAVVVGEVNGHKVETLNDLRRAFVPKMEKGETGENSATRGTETLVWSMTTEGGRVLAVDFVEFLHRHVLLASQSGLSAINTPFMKGVLRRFASSLRLSSTRAAVDAPTGGGGSSTVGGGGASLISRERRTKAGAHSDGNSHVHVSALASQAVAACCHPERKCGLTVGLQLENEEGESLQAPPVSPANTPVNPDGDEEDGRPEEECVAVFRPPPVRVLSVSEGSQSSEGLNSASIQSILSYPSFQTPESRSSSDSVFSPEGGVPLQESERGGKGPTRSGEEDQPLRDILGGLEGQTTARSPFESLDNPLSRVPVAAWPAIPLRAKGPRKVSRPSFSL